MLTGVVTMGVLCSSGWCQHWEGGGWWAAAPEVGKKRQNPCSPPSRWTMTSTGPLLTNQLHASGDRTRMAHVPPSPQNLTQIGLVCPPFLDHPAILPSDA